jgi:hypothetical protein
VNPHTLLRVVACAWVLWTVRAEGERPKWEAVRGYATLEECREAEQGLRLSTAFLRYRRAGVELTCLPETTKPQKEARE